MKLIRRIQMAFQDFDLTEQMEGKHELWEINETVNLTSVLYRLKDLEKEVGRTGYGGGCWVAKLISTVFV